MSLEVPEVCFRGQSIPISSSSIRPGFITPHFHQMRGCSSGASAPPGYSHHELHRRLVDFSSVALDGGSTSRRCSRPYERVGVTAERQEECASLFLRTTFLAVVWDSVSMHARLSSPRFDPGSCEKCKARPATHCQTVPETVGSHGSSFQRDTFWTAAHEAPAVVAQDQRVFPRGATHFAQSRSRGDAYVPWLCGRNLGSCPRAQCWELLVVANC